MSYIDTFKHEFLGNICDLPIYHPLETIIEPKGSYDFGCNPNNLVIGGGAGEHPAIVIHHLGSVVASYILYALEKLEENLADRFISPPQADIDRLHDIYLGEMEYSTDMLEFCHWRMANFKRFIERAMFPPDDEHSLKDEGQAENWLIDSLGQFIFYSLPELNPFDAEMKQMISKWDCGVGYWLNNVSCPPPNHVKSKSKSYQEGPTFKDAGYFRWDYTYPPSI